MIATRANNRTITRPVLLQGETGVGKNRVARLIHGYSGRKGDFVLVHAPGVAKELFESQLFGHRKGSFTGADKKLRNVKSAWIQNHEVLLDDNGKVAEYRV